MLESSYKPIESEGDNGPSAASSQEGAEAPDQNECLRALREQVNKTVIVSKLFYFFFYTALGSLFPFFSLFYKQLWLAAWQIGILLALRPAVKIVCLPLWKMVTDKFSKPKVVYFISILGWIIGYYGQSLIYPSNLPCYAYVQRSQDGTIAKMVPTPFAANEQAQPNISKMDVPFVPAAESEAWASINLHVRKHERSSEPETKNFGAPNDDRNNYASITDHAHDNELSEAEKNKLASDSVNKERSRHVHDLVISNDGPNEPLPYELVTQAPRGINPFPDPSEIRKSPRPPDDFRVKFSAWIFQTLVVIVILTEIITTPTPMLADSAVVRALVDSDSEYGRQRLFGSLGLSLAAILVAVWVTQHSGCSYTDTINYLPCFYMFEIAIAGTLVVSLFFNFEKPDGNGENGTSIQDGLKLFWNFKNGVFLVTLFLLGYSHSLQTSFLFWHLQDLGGTPVLFAIILLVYCFAEVVMYFVSPYVVDIIGQHGMISLALACYTARFLMYSYLTDPWLVIPMEVAQGVTYGGVWSITAVYVNAPKEASSLIQSILHFVYWGVGMALGAVVSGGVISVAGAPELFLVMAGICFVACLFHVIIDIYNKMQSLEDEHQHRSAEARGGPTKRKNKPQERYIGAAAAPMVPCLLYAK